MVKRKGNYGSRYPNTRSRYGYMAANAAAIAIQNAFRRSRSGTSTMTQQNRKYHSGQGITEQHDARTIYRKRNMPYRKKRRWKGFVRKVHHISEKELGTQTVVCNKRITGLDFNGNQIVLDFCLYGLNSTATEKNDITRIVGLNNTGDQTAAAGETVNTTTKFMFQSGVLDMTIRNSSFTTQALGPNLPADGTMEIDIYEIVSSRYWSNRVGVNLTPFAGIVSALNDALANTLSIGGAGTGCLLTQRGVTPFDVPHAMSTYSLKIMKKTKYKLSTGQTFTYQMRDAKRHVCTKEYAEDAGSPNKPGWTRWILLIAKGVPGPDYGTSPGQVQNQLDVGVTRKYMYKVEGINDTRDRYFAST